MESQKDNTIFMKNEEEKSFTESPEEETIPPRDIVVFNELRSCADLFRMAKSKNMNIQPDFQREIVWKNPEQTRFIDSLVKQLPIPSMCISIDYNTEERIVIDGLQRISTIKKFFSEPDWKMEELEDISKDISGKTVKEIHTQYPKIYERIENVIIPVAVLRYDSTKEKHNEYLFNIFHRLNTGGTKLNNQEIRNCIFSGGFNDLLKRLNQDPRWVKIQKIKTDRGDRYKKIELILRFFALEDLLKKYNGKLTVFLNEYMKVNRNPPEDFLNRKETLFIDTLCILEGILTRKKGRIRTGYAAWEALLYGVGKNISKLKKLNETEIDERAKKFFTFLAGLDLTHDLYSKSAVTNRLNKSEEIFSRD